MEILSSNSSNTQNQEINQQIYSTIDSQVETPKSGNNKLLIILLIICFVMISVFGGYYYISHTSNSSLQVSTIPPNEIKIPQVTQSLPSPEQPTPTVESSMSSGLKIYTAQDNSFSFSYPASWSETQQTQNIPLLTSSGKRYPDIMISFYQTPTKTSFTDPSTLSVQIFTNTDFSNLTPESFIKEVGGSYYKGGNYINIGSLKVFEAKANYLGSLSTSYIFNKGDSFYDFSNSDTIFTQPGKDFTSVITPILSSFKFMN